MNEGPVIIRRAGTNEEAGIIIAWLETHGITASALDRDNPGTLAFGVTDAEGVEICVPDAETAARAKKLLEQHDRQQASVDADTGSTAQAAANCEECGCENMFPVELRGTVQECTGCGAHVDVPAGPSQENA